MVSDGHVGGGNDLGFPAAGVVYTYRTQWEVCDAMWCKGVKDVASLWFGFLIRLRRHLRLKSARDGESLGNKVISESDLEIKGNRHSILGRSFAPASLITSEWL